MGQADLFQTFDAVEEVELSLEQGAHDYLSLVVCYDAAIRAQNFEEAEAVLEQCDNLLERLCKGRRKQGSHMDMAEKMDELAFPKRGEVGQYFGEPTRFSVEVAGIPVNFEVQSLATAMCPKYYHGRVLEFTIRAIAPGPFYSSTGYRSFMAAPFAPEDKGQGLVMTVSNMLLRWWRSESKNGKKPMPVCTEFYSAEELTQ